MTSPSDFRTRVREIMRVRGMTDADLAERLHVKTTSITKFLAVTRLTARTYRRYAEALGVSVEYLQGASNIEATLREVPARRDRPPVSITS